MKNSSTFTNFLQFFCCPGSFTTTSTPPPTTTQKVTTESASAIATKIPGVSDLDEVINHRNIKLINEKKCGRVLADKIIGGSEAELNELPWM